MRRPWKLRIAILALGLAGAGAVNLQSAQAGMGDEHDWVCVAVDDPVDKSVCQGNPVPGGVVHLPGPPDLNPSPPAAPSGPATPRLAEF